MKCTKIGGSELANSRVTFAGAVTYLVSGQWSVLFHEYRLCRGVTEGLFVFVRILRDDHLLLVGQQNHNRIRGSEFQGTEVSISEAAFVFSRFILKRLFSWFRFELGAAVFIGWGGSLLLLSGGTVLSYFSGKEGLKSRYEEQKRFLPVSASHDLTVSVHSSPKGSRRPPTYATARTRRTYMVPPSSSRVTLVPPLFYEGRRSRMTRTTGRTGRTFSRDSFV